METNAPEAERYIQAVHAVISMQLSLGERKIDLVVAYLEGSPEDRKDTRPIVRIARQTGVRLDMGEPDRSESVRR